MPDTPLRSTRALLWILIFVSGMTTMAVEMAASRLLGPYFGDSNLVWANLIGLVLICLTLGGYAGGRLADRYPRPVTLYLITTLAAFWVGLTPFVGRPLLRLAQHAFVNMDTALVAFEAIQFGGSFVGVLLLFAPPIALLGCVSPFAIRLETKKLHTAGRSAGQVYAVSTLGSILGTFLPVLLLIPWIGTAGTFTLFSFSLLVVSFIGLILHRARWPLILNGILIAILALITTLWPQHTVKADERMIYEYESRYNYIQVLDVQGVRYLMLNEGQGVHSIYDPDTLSTFGTWDMLTMAPLFNRPPFTVNQVKRVCIIGLAAGTSARQANAIYPQVEIDGVEVDPAIVRVGRTYFDMNWPNLHVFITDGRFFLEQTSSQYDLVIIDAYRLPYIPFQLATREFFSLVRSRLSPQGVVAVNVGRTESDYRMVEAIAATLGTQFPTLHAINMAGTFNTVLVATLEPTEADNLARNAALAKHPFIREVAGRALPNLHLLRGDGLVFTDDRAAVESLTNAIVLRYLLKGE